MTATSPKRRAVRPPANVRSKKQAPHSSPKNGVAKGAPATKLATLIAMLRSRQGATISQMMERTGWQAHSVRGAMAGAIKKQAGSVSSEKTGNERVYHLSNPK